MKKLYAIGYRLLVDLLGRWVVSLLKCWMESWGNNDLLQFLKEKININKLLGVQRSTDKICYACRTFFKISDDFDPMNMVVRNGRSDFFMSTPNVKNLIHNNRASGVINVSTSDTLASL